MKPNLNWALTLLILPGLTATSCKKEFSCEGCIAKKAPVANAGIDQTTVLPKDSVLLDGSGSHDDDGPIVKYEWTKIAGPSTFIILHANAMQTQVTNLIEGVYGFELKVSDAD